MFLAINQINGRAAKKRKKERQRQDTAPECGNVVAPTGGGIQTHAQAQMQAHSERETETIAAPQAVTATTIGTSALAAGSTANLIENMLLEYPSAVNANANGSGSGNISVALSPTTMTATAPTTANGGALLVKCKNCQHALSSGNAQQGNRKGQQPLPLQSLSAYISAPPPTTSANSLAAAARSLCQCDCDCVNKSLCSSAATTTPFAVSAAVAASARAPTSTPTHASSAPASARTPITSLYAVYMCFGILALALATLSVLFYSHVNANSHTTAATTATTITAATTPATSTPTATTESNLAFREQFRRELFASEHVLRSIVTQILQQEMDEQQQQNQHKQQQQQQHQQQQYVSNIGSASYADLNPNHYPQRTIRAASAAPYAATVGTVVKNERKFVASARYAAEAEAAAQAAAAIGRVARMRRDISSSPASMHADPFIEFFNPNHRKVLEEQDMEIRKRTGLKGAAPGGDEWIYLNTYCRVPEKIITGFCKGTQDYCPPAPQGPPGPLGPKGTTGPPGLPGIPGPKGNRGDVGLPGPPGVDGSSGPMGPRGPKGDVGIPGRAGLDGRDGVPGEPGLDGVPGRAGADGIPGKDGLPGLDGRDGSNGKDGKDGLPGPKGAQGPTGERGLKGIAGPRGRPGKPGSNGTPGIPGINAWKVQTINGSFSNDLLIPPSIADVNAPHIRRNVIVEEGKSLNLSCAASGNPMPHVEWRRDDGRTINIHGVEMSSVSGPFLRFNNITRHQMAAYTCFADNGIVPVANATFLVEVHFSPMIAVYRQMIYAEYGHSATLECMVEAFPEAIRYWERAYDGKILDPGDKYRIESFPEGFKTTMRLTITNLRKDDFGYYHCVARNEINATMVNFEIAPQDPNSETPYVGKEIKVYGQRPPESECAICEQCPDPSLYQCKDSINSNFEIQPTGNYSYPGLPKRQKSCLLYAVGKPVFHKAVNEIYGCWLKDPAAREVDREKTYVTNENDSYNLFEFTTKMQYRMNSVPRRKYEIREGFHGNAHVVYNGSFYYNQRNTDLVVKLDLTTQKKISTPMPYAGIAAGNRLYSTDYNYMDFNVDEVGLWVIYSTYDSNNTLVAKLDAETLKMQYNFNITLDHRKFGEMFIVCGHLYAIDSCTDKNSQIHYVVDLYNGKLLNVDLPFSNPFRKTSTVGYNPLTVELYSWDKGNALTYPIRYHEQILYTDHA